MKAKLIGYRGSLVFPVVALWFLPVTAMNAFVEMKEVSSNCQSAVAKVVWYWALVFCYPAYTESGRYPIAQSKTPLKCGFSKVDTCIILC